MPGPSIYPIAIDANAQLPLAIDGITPINSSLINGLRSAIINIQVELGIDPSGNFDDVKSRLENIDDHLLVLEDEVSNLQSTLGELGTEWKNISLISADHLNSADYDAPAPDIHNSFSSDETGTTISVENTTAVWGGKNGVVYDLGEVTTIFPEFIANGEWGIEFYGKEITPGPTGKDYWQGIVILSSAAYAGADYSGGVLVRAAGPVTKQAFILANSSGTLFSKSEAFWRWLPITSNSNSIISCRDDVSSTLVGTPSANPRIALIAGCGIGTSDGPHSGKILWFARAIRFSSPA